MDFWEVIEGRRSVRAFLPEPVPRETLERVLKAASQAPSWGDTQPWEVLVVTGERLEAVKKGFRECSSAQVPATKDLPFPETWPERLKKRSAENGRMMFERMGIDRADKEGRQAFWQKLDDLFGAPVGIYVCMERDLTAYSVFDLGLFSENLMLAARASGLDTCPMARMVAYPDVLRRELGLPGNLAVVIGIALGYADQEAPINAHKSPRVDLEGFATWYS